MYHCTPPKVDAEVPMTRDEVFKRLMTLGAGLNITFVLWGVLQVMSRRQGQSVCSARTALEEL